MTALRPCYLADWGPEWPIKRQFILTLPSKRRILCTSDLGAAMRSQWVAEILPCRVFSGLFVASPARELMIGEGLCRSSSESNLEEMYHVTSHYHNAVSMSHNAC